MGVQTSSRKCRRLEIESLKRSTAIGKSLLQPARQRNNALSKISTPSLHLSGSLAQQLLHTSRQSPKNTPTPIPVRQRETVRPVPVAAAAWQASRDTRSGGPIVSKVDIPDSFFEDLFGEIEGGVSQSARDSSKQDGTCSRTMGLDDLWGDAF